jgi:hypothetical protein
LLHYHHSYDSYRRTPISQNLPLQFVDLYTKLWTGLEPDRQAAMSANFTTVYDQFNNAVSKERYTKCSDSIHSEKLSTVEPLITDTAGEF